MRKVSASVASKPPSRGWTALVAALVLALFLALSACGGPPEADEVEPYPPPNPLIYELANAGGEVEGWLLGTIHALPEGISWRTDEIDRVVDEADLVLVEVAELGASDEIAKTFAEISRSSGLEPIDRRVSEPLRPQLLSMLANSDFNATQFGEVEDWAAAIMLSQVDAPGEPKYGVDRALIADFEGRPVRGFETAESQLGIFDQLAAEDQRALLEETVAEWKASRDDPERLMRAWLVGNIEALEEATNSGIMTDPELRDALLVKRNDDWMVQLVPLLDESPKPMIAVGAAHLVGPDGLVLQLEEAGYSVTRLPAR